jgi:hypothetical protein
MTYLLTAIGLSPGGSSTVHIYTQTIHRTIQNKQYIEQRNNFGRLRAVPSWLLLPWHLPYNRVTVLQLDIFLLLLQSATLLTFIENSNLI